MPIRTCVLVPTIVTLTLRSYRHKFFLIDPLYTTLYLINVLVKKKDRYFDPSYLLGGLESESTLWRLGGPVSESIRFLLGGLVSESTRFRGGLESESTRFRGGLASESTRFLLGELEFLLDFLDLGGVLSESTLFLLGDLSALVGDRSFLAGRDLRLGDRSEFLPMTFHPSCFFFNSSGRSSIMVATVGAFSPSSSNSARDFISSQLTS